MRRASSYNLVNCVRDGRQALVHEHPGSEAQAKPAPVPTTPNPKLAKARKEPRYLETVAPSQIGMNRYVRMSERLSRKSDAAKDHGTLVHLWLSKIAWSSQVPSDATLRELAEPYADRVDVGKTLKQFKKLLKEESLAELLDRETYLRDLRKSSPNLPDDIEIEVRLEQPLQVWTKTRSSLA